MNKRCWSLAALAAIMVWGTGCVVTSGKDRYERCVASDVCVGVSTCQLANTPVEGMPQQNFCTQGCAAGNDCPSSANGVPAACVSNGGTGQCYRQCDSAGGCPAGETCSTLVGMPTRICVPGASCGDANQACCAGNQCTLGLVCGTPPGGTGLICGTAACGTANQPCCAGDMCSSGLVCGTPVGGT